MDQSQTLNSTGPGPAGVVSPSGAWVRALKSPLLLGLLALLGVQILVAVLLSVGGRGSLTPAALDSPLLEFDPESVTAIRIEGGSEGPVTLSKADQDWVLANLSDFPADGVKVDQLIDKLASLKRPLPIATSPEAQRRHKVADEGFERKVSLQAGDKTVAALLLGDSPGFRRVFARPEGESVVYDLELPLFDVSNRRDDWLSRDSLRVGQESIERVSSGDWSLVKTDGSWKLDGSDQAPDEQAVSGLLSRIANLSYRGVLGSEDKAEYNQSTPTLEITVGLADGTERDYRISQPKDSQDYVLKVSDRPWYFKLSEFDLEGLKDLDRSKLAGTVAPDAEAAMSDSPRSEEGEAGAGAVEGAGPLAPSRPAAEGSAPPDSSGSDPEIVPEAEEPPSSSRPE